MCRRSMCRSHSRSGLGQVQRTFVAAAGDRDKGETSRQQKDRSAHDAKSSGNHRSIAKLPEDHRRAVIMRT